MYNDIDHMIACATKEHKNKEKDVLRLIKNEFVKYEKSGKTLTEVEEVKILLKMAAQHKDSIEQYTNGGRDDLANAEKEELTIIEKYIPKQPTMDEIVGYTEFVIDKLRSDGNEISMKVMKTVLSKVQQKYPLANGKTVSQVVKNNI